MLLRLACLLISIRKSDCVFLMKIKFKRARSFICISFTERELIFFSLQTETRIYIILNDSPDNTPQQIAIILKPTLQHFIFTWNYKKK